MKLTEHDNASIGYCVDSIIYFENMIDQHPEISDELRGDFGSFEFRGQCALWAMDFDALIHGQFEDWHDFIECAKRYFDNGANTADLWKLDTWDSYLCPAILSAALEIWKKDKPADMYAIREYHARVLTEICNA